MAEKKVRCVEIRGNRVKFLPESIARNQIRMRQIGFMIQEIDEPVFEPTKPFPVVEKIVEPTATVDSEPTAETAPKPKAKAKPKAKTTKK
jgi:outer membrane biosynthesis protein TonB